MFNFKDNIKDQSLGTTERRGKRVPYDSAKARATQTLLIFYCVIDMTPYI